VSQGDYLNFPCLLYLCDNRVRSRHGGMG